MRDWGKTAESVGKKLRNIAGRHQLICITHLPQIASLAGHHLRIDKSRGTNWCMSAQLSGSARQDEIARMLSGTVTEISRRHAEELLERTG
jgi:DNA repair protein RecN (Recombination protein N)